MSTRVVRGRTSMLIVTGHLLVAPPDRDAYLATCRDVVQQGRAAPGCLDFSLSADLVDPARINVLERWQDAASAAAFRGAGTPDVQLSMIVSADVAEYEIGEMRLLS